MKKVITLVALVTAVFALGRAQTCDTLLNLVSVHDTATVLAASADSGGGYLSGNNVFGDIAVAEAFPVADSGSFVTTATLYFGVATINPTDSNNLVTIYVWDDLGQSVFGGKAPLDVVDSAQVTLAQIALAVTEHKGLLVHFSGTTGLQKDTVFVGVLLPAVSGDTIALLTNTAFGTDGAGYVLALDPSGSGAYTWNTYNDNYQFGTTGSIGNYIKVSICSTPNPSPAANFSGSVSGNCNPVAVTLNDFSGPPSPTYWAWYFGDGNTANGPVASDVYSAAGVYVAMELVSCDTGNVVEVFVPAFGQATVLPSPVVNATVTPSMDSMPDASAFVTIVSPTGHYFTTWIDSGTTILTASDTLTGVFNGVYVVRVQDQNGCIVNDSVFIEPLTTGIIKLSATEQLNVYPNPATDVLNMVWSTPAKAEISVIDLNGNVVSTLITNGDIKTVYDIHNLSSGAYILRITDKSTNQQQSRLFTKF